MDYPRIIKSSANLSCFIAMFLWALGFVAAENLFNSWGALAMLSARLVISASFLLVWWGIKEGKSAIFSAPWKKGIVIGSVGWGIGGILLLIGQKLSDPVTTTIAVAMMPLSAAAIETFFGDRNLTPRLVCGITLALLGGYLATGARFSDSGFGVGVILCLGAITLFAWATRATTRNLKTLSSTGQTTVTLTGAMLITVLVHAAALVTGFGETTIGQFGIDNLWILLIFMLLSCGIAQLFWIWGADRLGVLLASFHMNIVPFYVMAMLVLVVSAEWQWIQALGAAIVALAVLISQMGTAPLSRTRD